MLAEPDGLVIISGYRGPHPAHTPEIEGIAKDSRQERPRKPLPANRSDGYFHAIFWVVSVINRHGLDVTISLKDKAACVIPVGTFSRLKPWYGPSQAPLAIVADDLAGHKIPPSSRTKSVESH